MVTKKHVSRTRTESKRLTQSGFGGKRGASRAKFALPQNTMCEGLDEGFFFVTELARLITDIQEQLPDLKRAGPGRSCGAATNSQERKKER